MNELELHTAPHGCPKRTRPRGRQLWGASLFTMRVEITNLQHFAANEFGGASRFRTQVEIIADLWKQANGQSKPAKTILVEYKDWGDVVFDLQRVDRVNGIAYYEFTTTAS